jgi:hypothetical protein
LSAPNIAKGLLSAPMTENCCGMPDAPPLP